MKHTHTILLFIFFTSLSFLLSCQKTKNKTISEHELPLMIQKIADSLQENSSIDLHYRTTIKLLNRLEQQYPQNKFPQIYAWSNLVKAKCYKQQPDSALFWAKKANEFYRKSYILHNNIAPYIDVLGVIGGIYRRKGMLIQSLQAIDEAFFIVNINPSYVANSKNFIPLGRLYMLRGELYQNEHENAKARTYVKKGMYYLSKSKYYSRDLVGSYIQLGIEYRKDLLIDSSLYYMHKAVQLTSPIDTVLLVVGNMLLGESCLIANKNDSCIKYVSKALAYNNLLQRGDEVEMFQKLMSAHENKGDIKLANQYYQLSKKNLLNNKIGPEVEPYEVSKALLSFAMKYNKYSDIDTLLRYHLKEHQHIYNADRTQALKDLEVKYQVKAHQDNIQKLKIENELKASQIQQRTSIFVGLLILSGFLAYFLSRQRQLKHKQESSELQQRFLRSQMNPHFMSNALMAIQAEMLEGKSKLATHYLNKYAELTRLIFENSRSKFITIFSEVKVIEDYLLLQKIRFPDKFDYTLTLFTSIEEETGMIPPMLIQPIIENAIEHGFRNIAYKGELLISFQKQNNSLIVSIQDNGRGINIIHQTNHKKSLSSSITEERLAMLAKETKQTANINIGEVKPHGVFVKLTIPLTYEI